MERSEAEAKIKTLNDILGWDSYRCEWDGWNLTVRKYTENGTLNGNHKFQFPYEIEKFIKWTDGLPAKLAQYARTQAAPEPQEPRTEPVSCKIPKNVFDWIEEQAKNAGDTRSGKLASLLEAAYAAAKQGG
ncbi:hypothetical protein [Deinococcus roseus]|uniref:Uncharacterized protein n=1 Tax=Deinococcus roseus TaxID=392414 RepID=A0ABQ2DI78_9DEIO|nr:hypothetical protein [Deinococcus roseus]GGJ55700.1 hypothetical protein GCM10008938_47360 [Deinococcus roseus]